MLLGASLIIAIASMLDAFGVVDFRSADKSATWVFVDAFPLTASGKVRKNVLRDSLPPGESHDPTG